MNQDLSEEEFLRRYRRESYEKPSVAVDLLIFTIKNEKLCIYMTKRQAHPFWGGLCLPGVFVRMDETLEEAAKRCFVEKTGFPDGSEIYFEQLYTWSGIHRDPRMRIISVSYIALVPLEQLQQLDKVQPEGMKLEEQLFVVEELLEKGVEVAFDHKDMIEYGKERIKNKAEYSKIAFAFLPETFTLPQLQRTYEILLDKSLYKANFRKKVQDMVEETGEMVLSGAHRPSKLYRAVQGEMTECRIGK